MSGAATGALVDAHAHIQVRQFDADRVAVLQRAAEAGLGAIICASDDLPSSRAAIALAACQPLVWATVGVHPHEAASYDEAAEAELTALAGQARVVAIGEIGLDYYRDLAPREVQRAAFERQLELASRLRRPVVVHSRDAAGDSYTILRAWRSSTGDGTPGLMHCFGYDAVWAERFLALGFLLSVPGTVTFPNAEQTRTVAAMVPEDRLTVETDCPYLAPQSRRGKRNEPAYVTETVTRIAALRRVDPLELGRTAGENARRLFGLDGAPGGAG